MVENPGLMEFKYLNPLPLEQSNYDHQLNELITSSDDQEREVCWDYKKYDTDFYLFVKNIYFLFFLQS